MTPVKKVTAGGAILALIASLFTLGFLQPASAVGTTVFNPTADTYVQADLPDTNFGSSVRWSTEGRANIWRNALLRFNVTVPVGEHVVSAKLRAYSEAATTATEFVDVYGTTGTWTEAGATWNNAPARSTWLGKQGNFATSSWVEWDVTPWVSGDGGYTNFKLETNAQKWVGFKSKEATDPALKPQLVITTEADVSTEPTGTPTPTPTGTTPPPAGDGTQAATTQNWGNVVTGDEFNYTGIPDPTKWSVYNSAGHAGNGLRSPAQASVNGTVFNIDGTADGTTAGMSAKFANQKYGRWESRIKASGDDEYHMVSILWPDSGNWPCDGEIDYAETTGSFSAVHFFQHYSCANSQSQISKNPLDVTQWHNYAVDWSPTGIVGYIDGVEWFRDNDLSHLPPGPMHQTLQLDWFPNATADGTGNMQVDWVRVYLASNATPPPPDPTTPPTTPPPATGDYTFGTVGDANGSGNTSTSSNSGKNAAGIIGALNNGSIENFISLGDHQYDQGSCSSLGAWNTLWGAAKSKMYWIAGPNHDVEPGRNDVADFMNGACSGTWDDTKSARNAEGLGTSSLEWYSFDKGNWHFVMAPTAVWRYNATRAAQMTGEMRTNIQAAKAAGKHIIVAYHDPYFTSKTSSHDRETLVKPWIDMWSDEGVRVLLSGSQHNYERSCAINKSDVCTTGGMQQFQVSTGGIGLRAFTSSPAYIVKRFSDTYGWLKMTLHADGSYDWNYNAVSGPGTDSGSRAANQ